MAQVAAGVRAMPPNETPIAATATARPRSSTNHLASVTFATKLPNSAALAVSATPFNNTHPTSVCTWLNAHSDALVSNTPATMNGRPPKRSTHAPMKKPVSAITKPPKERGTVNSARVQPSSSVIGARNAPAT